ncbi:alpha/beta hydrolase [Rhodovulum adriaticum]|uniref:Esterase/lipase superfamily enzyme n=1 Tax=Rhodovulum adriaticum TaxID=35804 RepID=A0A4R2P111_RHOAD|nr:alpha/beta fold hydrolase [Rhodovulum adriaticum]MBK1634879.1 hypothetical protein [Rhodovulum adriaticum]TCP27541.1 esterase/lipase superfamily enzyme [Rhodovulum adriaticum]
MRRVFLVLIVVALAACAPRGGIVVVPAAAPEADLHTVFMATTRTPTESVDFSNERNPDLTFGAYTVAIPPDRQPGTVRYPRANPDLREEFVTVSADLYDAPRAFTAALSRELRQRPPGKRGVVVFVHGFNTNFAEGLYRTAQLTHDFGIESVPLHYSWPSSANPLGYAHDRDSTLFARSGFASYLDSVIAAGPEEVLIVAHSMGSLLTMETLRTMSLERPGRVARDIDGLVLFSPDIDIQVFRSQVRDIARMPRDVIVFTSKRDRALQLSARLSGDQRRLGNVGDIDDVADLDITILDVTEFSRGLGHFTPGTSPELIRVLSNIPSLERALNEGAQVNPGLLPGTVLTVQNATAVILSPLTALSAQP